jgi:type IV pilus assembly protein PilA
LNLGSSAETAVSEGFNSNDVPGIASVSASWAATPALGGFTPTKYVSALAINAATGVVTVTYNFNPLTGGIAQLTATTNTITLSPYINKLALARAMTGNIDWVCASSSQVTASAAIGGAAVPAVGTILPKYVPTQCK